MSRRVCTNRSLSVLMSFVKKPMASSVCVCSTHQTSGSEESSCGLSLRDYRWGDDDSPKSDFASEAVCCFVPSAQARASQKMLHRKIAPANIFILGKASRVLAMHHFAFVDDECLLSDPQAKMHVLFG